MEFNNSDDSALIIRKTLIATGLMTDQIDYFLALAEVKTLNKKEFLITQGSVCSFIGIVTKGIMRSYVTKEAKEFNNDFYIEGQFVSAYTSFVTRNPTSMNIEALEDVEIYCLSHKQYNDLFEKEASWWSLGKHIADIFFIKKCRREISFLKQSAAERLHVLLTLYPGIEQRVSQYHIASYLGIRPESLSRIKLLTYVNRIDT